MYASSIDGIAPAVLWCSASQLNKQYRPSPLNAARTQFSCQPSAQEVSQQKLGSGFRAHMYIVPVWASLSSSCTIRFWHVALPVLVALWPCEAACCSAHGGSAWYMHVTA